MRNSFKSIFSISSPKFQVVKFNPNGYNSPLKVNLFSVSNSFKNPSFNSILVPVFDTKTFYSNFTYKYFNLKWSKFEQKSNYYKYVKSPNVFPIFTGVNNYFSNSFLRRRKKSRLYKRRRTRYSIYFRSRFLSASKSVFRSYKLIPFYPKRKLFCIRKKLLRRLAKRKSKRILFFKFWGRRKRKFNYKGKRWYSRKSKTFIRFSKRIKKKIYFKGKRYKLRVFKFFRFKSLTKKIRYARRYAYRKLRVRRKSRIKLFSFLSFYSRSEYRPIFKINFFKRLVKKTIKRRYFFLYLKKKLAFKLRSRVFTNRFKVSKFLDFKNYLINFYFCNYIYSKRKTSFQKKYGMVNNLNNKFFSTLFTYPQTFFPNKNFFFFKFFSIYSVFKRHNCKFFYSQYKLNFKQIYQFYKTFKNFYAIVNFSQSNFIPFNFRLSKKSYFKRFSSRVKALQYLQRRKLIRNFRFYTYFSLFAKIAFLKRNTRFYRKIIKKFIKFVYKRIKTGRILYFLPFNFNTFFYYGLLSHFNPNIYSRDPSKFNNFYSTKIRKSNFILRNKN